jgi:hypothetical protein
MLGVAAAGRPRADKGGDVGQISRACSIRLAEAVVF